MTPSLWEVLFQWVNVAGYLVALLSSIVTLSLFLKKVKGKKQRQWELRSLAMAIVSIAVALLAAVGLWYSQSKAASDKDRQIVVLQGQLKEEKEKIQNLERETTASLQRVAALAAPPTLSFDPVTYIKTPFGTTITLTLKPSRNEPLGQVVLQAQITSGSEARILHFLPGPSFLVKERIGADGKSATMFFTPMSPTDVRAHLELSASCTVAVTGDHGLPMIEVKVP